METINNQVGFDSDSNTAIVDNSANTHIWTVESDSFPGTLMKMTKADTLGVATIRGVELIPHLIGDVQTSWRDDAGKSFDFILKGAFFPPDLPVNIVSVTALAEQLNDDSGTWIQRSRYVSIFTWDFGKLSKIIVHPTSSLPQLQMND